MPNISEENDVEAAEKPFDSLFAIPGRRLSLTANRIVQDFTITTDSYILLCTNLYEVLCAENPQFADTISESAFLYYAIMILWERLRDFAPSQSYESSPFFKNLEYFKPFMTAIPVALEIYLKGIGNFTHPYLGEMRFRLPELLLSERFDLTTGTFGKVSAETHSLYEAFPAPGIAALRILADVSHTNRFFGEPMWDLPKGLRPDFGDDSAAKDQEEPDPYRPKPTRNLLGWALAQSLTENQMKLFRDCGMESTVTQNDMVKFFECSGKLLKTISDYFSCTKIPVKAGACSNQKPYNQDPYNSQNVHSVVKYNSHVDAPKQGAQVNIPFSNSTSFTKLKSLTFTGSIIQGLSAKRIFDNEPFKFDRSAMYCNGTVSVFSSSEESDNFVTGAVVTGYRMPKEQISFNTHSWACYDFNKYTSVPDSWIATRNSIYEFGGVEGLNKPMWTSGTVDRKLMQYSFFKKHMLKSEDDWNIYT